MEVYTANTEVIKFTGNGHRCKSVFLFNGKRIESVSTSKFLGIEFSSSCTWRNAIINRRLSAIVTVLSPFFKISRKLNSKETLK